MFWGDVLYARNKKIRTNLNVPPSTRPLTQGWTITFLDQKIDQKQVPSPHLTYWSTDTWPSVWRKGSKV